MISGIWKGCMILTYNVCVCARRRSTTAHAHADDVCKKACPPARKNVRRRSSAHAHTSRRPARSALWACAHSINQSFTRPATAGGSRRASKTSRSQWFWIFVLTTEFSTYHFYFLLDRKTNLKLVFRSGEN